MPRVLRSNTTHAAPHGAVALGRAVLGGLMVAGLLMTAACSRDRGARPPLVTTQEDPSSTTLPSPPSTAANRGPTTTVDESKPLELAWVRQIGGIGNDGLAAVTGRKNTVVSVGSTTGISTPAKGGRDVLSVVVGTDGTVQTPHQTGSDGGDKAAGVADSNRSSLACGTSDSSSGPLSSGTPDGWCAPVGADGSLGEEVPIGGTAEDALVAVAMPRLGARDAKPAIGYAAGFTAGVLPGAQDPTGRGLGDGDSVLVKVDASGTPVWTRQFGSFAADRASGVTTTEDGDALVVGVTGGDAAGQSAGGDDGYVARFDPTGNQRWASQIGSPGDDTLAAVAATGEARRGSELFVAGGATNGTVGSASAGGSDALVVALGPDGRRRWSTQFGTAGDDRVTAVVADGSNIFVAGTTDGPLGTLRPDLGPGGGRDGFLVALDATTGKVQWTSRFGSAADEEIGGIATTDDGLLVLSGVTAGQLTGATSAGNTDGLLIAFRLPASGGGAASSV